MDAGGQGLLNPIYAKASATLECDYECIMVFNVRTEKKACSLPAGRPGAWLFGEM